MLVIFNEKGNVLQQGPCPYFVGSLGEVYSVFLENILIGIDESLIDVKKTAACLHAECLDVVVEIGDGVIGHEGKFHGKQAVDQYFGIWKIMIELDENFLQRIDEFKIAAQDVIGADHDQDHVGILDLLLYIGQ